MSGERSWTTSLIRNCNRDEQVSVNEPVKAVNIALGTAPLGERPTLCCNGNGQVTVDRIVKAVNNASNGCPGSMAIRTSWVGGYAALFLGAGRRVEHAGFADPRGSMVSQRVVPGNKRQCESPVRFQ
jgi:hypothetical protein